MSEFIGSRISLVSRSDIRYVGTLHEINSETSTVALENVTSFGTEGRKNNPDEEIAASDSIYDYIVFRGSDVKDLRIEEAPAVKENKPPQVPNDPAILGSGSRPQAQAPPSQAPRPTSQQQPPPPIAPQQQQGPPPPQFPHSPYPPPFYPPQWGRGGPGFPPMPYGGPPPPGWYPGPPGQGFPGGPMPPYGQFPPGPPGQHFQPPPTLPHQQQQQQQQPPKPSPIGPGAPKQQLPSNAPSTDVPVEKSAVEQPVEAKSPSFLFEKDSSVTPAPASAQPQAPAPVQETPSPVAEPNPPAEEKKAPEKPAIIPTGPAASKNAAPTKPKNNGRILPAIPLQSSASIKAPMQSPAPAAKTAPAPSNPMIGNAVLRDATQAATAAVAAAMAKLPPASGQQTNGNDAVDNLTKKVNEMRTDAIRAPRQPGAGGFSQSHRGRGRGGPRQEARKVEVPATDFDFETANAKFNKQDLVKEIVDTPNGSATEDVKEAKDESAPAGPSYNKSTSFFDNISSEIKDRQEGNGSRPGGREWRGEEQKKNVETFGQGSVDNGFGRGGYRGRGRGRGGMRGRGGYGGNVRGRGGYRGRGDGQAATQQ